MLVWLKQYWPVLFASVGCVFVFKNKFNAEVELFMSDIKHFVTLTDTHLNVSNGHIGIFGMRGQDSTIKLLENTLYNARALNPSLSAFFYLGDSAVHSWAGDFIGGPLSDSQVLDIVDVSLSTLQKYFSPNDFEYGGIFTLFGNNDYAPDYASGKNELELLSYTDSLVNRINATNHFKTEAVVALKQLSCYEAIITPKLSAIVINTVFYSPLYSENASVTDPFGQFNCMARTLSQLKERGAKVYVVGHIPPACSSFDGNPQWHEVYISQYVRLIAEFKDIIVAQLYGHTHRNEYRITKPGDERCDDCPPMIIFGGISPIFGNNPTFSSWNVNVSSGIILGIKAFYAQLEPNLNELNWLELLETSKDFQLPQLTTPYLQELSRTMMNELELDILKQNMVSKYLKYVHSNSGISSDSLVRRWYVCSTFWVQTKQEFLDCTTKFLPNLSENILFLEKKIGPLGDHLLYGAKLTDEFLLHKH